MPPKPVPAAVAKDVKPKDPAAGAQVHRWMKSGALCWIELMDQSDSNVVGYSQATIDIVKEEEKKIVVNYEPGHNGPPEVYVNRVLERAEEPQLNDDLVDIEPLNDAELLRCLEIRYKSDIIYCFCGPSLLSTNPYKRIDNPDEEYDRAVFKKYAFHGGKRIPKPHIWNMSAIVFWQLLECNGAKDQAICISGESGAGKSHSTRLCLSFITQLMSDKSNSGEITIEDKIMGCNPIMESFGNAKTIRNNDSSRFGKYFLLFVDLKSKQIKGSKIENYLLEKSRVVGPSENERNYHIFYAVLKNMTSEEQEKYMFSDSGKADMNEYPYLSKSGCYSVREIDDERIYNDVKESFNRLGFTPDEQAAVWKILSIILNLSKVQIDPSTYDEGTKPCSIVDSIYMERVLKLFNFKKENLVEGLCYKKLTAEVSQIITPTQCEGIKDALAKDLFNSLFNWLILKMNVTLLPPSKEQLPSIGLLDIFGFEDFTINSMEQLCINYTNEKLQKLYIYCVFIAEKRIFDEEGLGQHSDKIKTNENTEVLKLFESTSTPYGIFQLIDSACITSSDNTKAETSLINSVHQQHSANHLMTLDKLKPELFGIRHTAKKVTYSASGFPEKNRDEIPLNLFEACAKGDRIIYRIFKQKVTDAELNEKPKDEKQKKTLVSKFRQDMEGLMKKLENSGCNFIRCLKPNEEKMPDLWNPLLFLTQIKYMGILDSIKVRRESFPLRRAFKEFYAKYKDLDAISPERAMSFVKLAQKPNVDYKKLCENIVKSVESKTPPNQVLFGKTRVFMNIVYAAKLEELLDDVQKGARVALSKINLAFQKWDFIHAWNIHRKQSIKIMNLTKKLMLTWSAKVEYHRFLNGIRLAIKAQQNLRYIIYKRNLRLQDFSTKVIGRSYRLYKIKENIINARKRLQCLTRCFKVLKFRLFLVRARKCKAIVDIVFEKAWETAMSRVKMRDCMQIQRIWRGHLARQAKMEDVKNFRNAKQTIIRNKAQKTIAKHSKGFIVRSRLDRMRRAAFFIQGFFRGLILQKYRVLVRETVVKIQRGLKKFFLRKRIVNVRMNNFSKKNKDFMQQIKNIESDVIFKQGDTFNDIKGLENYTKVKFFEDSKDFREFIPKLDGFIPPNPPIDLNPKMRLFSVIIDFDCFADTSDIYRRGWAVDFLNYLSSVGGRNCRMMSLEVGDSFTLGIDDDLKIYSWGLNDMNQLGRTPDPSKADSDFPNINRKMSNLIPRMIASGDNHTLMVDYSNELYVWGSNIQGQFGLGHPRDVFGIVHLKTLGNKIHSIAAKGNKNYVLTEKGNIYRWPNPDIPQYIYLPCPIPANKPLIHFTQVFCGRNFAMALSSNCLVFSTGANKFGQLGHGDTEPRSEFCLIEMLKDYGEKVTQISCGSGHTICLTSSSKVFTWGLCSRGQLGTGETRHAALPVAIKIDTNGSIIKPKSVQAGNFNSFVLLENKRLYHCGQISKSDRYCSQFIPFEYEEKVFGGRLGADFNPLMVTCKWSRSVCVTYLTVADFRRNKNTPAIRDKIAEQVWQGWEELRDQIFPPFNDSVNKYVCPRYIKKINLNQEKIGQPLPEGEPYDMDDNTHHWQAKSTMIGGKDKELPSKSRGKENKTAVEKVQKGGRTVLVTPEDRKEVNPYNMTDPRFDKSYNNLYQMRKRLEYLLSIDENEWTEEDKKMINTLNKMKPTAS
jgi:myosin-5